MEGSPEGDKPEIGKTLERLRRTRDSVDIKIEPAQALNVKVESTTADVYWIGKRLCVRTAYRRQTGIGCVMWALFGEGKSGAARRSLRTGVMACLHAQFRWAQMVDPYFCVPQATRKLSN